MSHFTVLVVGNDPEKQLAPFNEQPKKGSPYLKFEDKTDEFLKEYQTGTTSEFYCSSSSSWGAEISNDLFNKLKENQVGFESDYVVRKNFGSYFKNRCRYRAYERDENNKPIFTSKQWFEVIGVKETTHPDMDVCFEGVVRIKKIDAPKELPLNVMYSTFDDFISNYHGIESEPDGKYGYWRNPNSKWDWFTLGGRYSGKIQLKVGTTGETGKSGAFDNEVGIDSAKKGDIANLNEIQTFAVLKDGQWYERGEMGWWACVSNEMTDEQWDAEYNKLISDLPDDTLLSIYDCHI